MQLGIRPLRPRNMAQPPKKIVPTLLLSKKCYRNKAAWPIFATGGFSQRWLSSLNCVPSYFPAIPGGRLGTCWQQMSRTCNVCSWLYENLWDLRWAVRSLTRENLVFALRKRKGEMLYIFIVLLRACQTWQSWYLVAKLPIEVQQRCTYKPKQRSMEACRHKSALKTLELCLGNEYVGGQLLRL